MANVTLDNNLGLNLCIVATTCHVVVTSDSQSEKWVLSQSLGKA